MTQKIGRNAPCPCGSGTKYKKCCLPLQQADPRPPSDTPPVLLWDDDGLDELSNSVVDLIKAGRLDQAQTACDELKRRFPDVIDWLERSALVAEARGDSNTAADFYRRCVSFTYQDPEGFDDDSRAWMIENIKRLDPDGPPPPGPPPSAHSR